MAAACGRPARYGRGQATQEPGQQIALIVIHVEFERGRVELLRWCEASLVLPGHFQAELIGTRRPVKIVETGDLGLPSEPAEPAVGQPAHPSLNFREKGKRALLGLAQDLIGNRVDLPAPKRARVFRRPSLIPLVSPRVWTAVNVPIFFSRSPI